MKWSLILGRFAGIKVMIHWTFLILIAWIVFVEVQRGSNTTDILITIGFVLTIFLFVVLHEFGHALTARRFGIDTKKITLLPIGGVASLEKMPEEPKRELLIAVAGPAVNVALAILLAFFVDFGKFSDSEQLQNMQSINNQNFLFSLFAVNVMLVLFNAIPAFPMDGGRVLRAVLAMKMDRVKATNIASRLGQFAAIGFVFFGLLYNPILILIGIFIFFGAYSENMIVQHLELLKGFQVKDAMMTNFTRLSSDSTLKDAADGLLSGNDDNLIVLDGEKVVGILPRNQLISSLKDKNMERRVDSIMFKDFKSVNYDHKLTDIYATLQKKKDTIIPVLDDERLVGAINMQNINEFVMIQSSLNY